MLHILSFFLGHFAVKKIAVGQSHDYLVTILREVSANISQVKSI